MATGLGNLWLDPYLLALPRLHWKLGLVALALVLAVVHDFVLGPRARRGPVGPRPRLVGRADQKVIEDRAVRRLGSVQAEPTDIWIIAATARISSS